MKTLLLLALTATSVAVAAPIKPGAILKPVATYSCSLKTRPGGPRFIGIPYLSIVEHMVPAGPMMPAFRHEFVLVVTPQNPNAPATQYKLVRNTKFNPSNYTVYDAVNERNESAYKVRQDHRRGLFEVYLGNSVGFTCVADNRRP